MAGRISGLRQCEKDRLGGCADAVLTAARALAAADNTSIGAALSSLARRGLAGSSGSKPENGTPVFTPARGARPTDHSRPRE